MDQIDKNRHNNMAEVYNAMAPYLVPNYDLFQIEIVNLIVQEDAIPERIIDLGAGSGILLERLLTAFPDSHCYWVDSSLDFMRVAKDKLHRFNGRVTYIDASMEDNWASYLSDGVDLITSMTAIHHLETHEKKDLYRVCFETLRPGGWFFNIDEMRSVSDDAYRNSLLRLVKHVDDFESIFSGLEAEHYKEFVFYFERWKKRNIDEFDRPKTKGEDIHESFMDQIQWLADAGFQDTDLFMKYHLWSMIGGKKADLA